MASPYGSTDENIPTGENGIHKQVPQSTEHTVQSDESDLEQASSKSAFSSRKALWGFLVLCYSVRNELLLLNALNHLLIREKPS